MTQPGPDAATDAVSRLDALSPLDGRYGRKLEPYADCFSERALMRARVRVEVEWFIELSDLPEIVNHPPLTDDARRTLRGFAGDFSAADAGAVKAIEDEINHDVKSVEYWLKRRLGELDLDGVREYVHFACTSEDINNLAYGLMVNDARRLWLADAHALVDAVETFARDHRSLAMLAHTHGQPATPTTLGKEMAVFVHRWRRKLTAIEAHEMLGKLNGATGTFSAHRFARPDVDWPAAARRVVERLGLTWNPLTTQIESHDSLVELLQMIGQFDAVLIDFDRDVWSYVSLGYLRQRPVEGEVGSSTMPHKINPIRFENSEANAGVANALIQHLAAHLPMSRLQRDLTDSSTLRNVGPAIAHSALAIGSARDGFRVVEPDPQAIAADLDDAWEVIGEGVQTLMRDLGVDDPYERLKELTRGRRTTAADIHEFVDGLEVGDDEKARLRAITPSTYTGLASDLVDELDDDR